MDEFRHARYLLIRGLCNERNAFCSRCEAGFSATSAVVYPMWRRLNVAAPSAQSDGVIAKQPIQVLQVH
jgi:hypothetical protein